MSARRRVSESVTCASPALGEVSDADLLDRFVAHRDAASFAALVARHGPMVFGVCRRLLRHAHDAEDAFQATFLILVRKAAAIRKRELLGNWLYGVALRVAARARLTAVQRQQHEKTDLRRIGAATREPAEAEDLSVALVEEVQHLPAKYRGPVILYYLEGRTNEEVAGQLDCPVGTIKTRLSRAREMLRKRLVRRGLALSAMGFTTALLAETSAAELPSGLIETTTKAASYFAAGDATAGGLVSAPTAALTKGVLQTMYLTKIKMLGVTLLALVTLVAGVSGFTYYRAAAEAAQADAKNIQGAWKVESAKANGQEPQGAEGDRIKGSTWTITADKITVSYNGEDRVSTYKLNPAAKLKTIDVETNAEGTFKGIYKLEGDTLTICASLARRDGERPTEFVSKEDSNTMLFVLKRVKE